MCHKCREAGTGLAAFLLGAVVGAAAGLLFAPAKGETTRKKLKRWANDTYEDQKELMLEHAQELKGKVKEHFDDAVIYKEVPLPPGKRSLKTVCIKVPGRNQPFDEWDKKTDKTEY